MGVCGGGVHGRRIARPRDVPNHVSFGQNDGSGADAFEFYRVLERLQYVDDLYAGYPDDRIRFVPLSIQHGAGDEFHHIQLAGCTIVMFPIFVLFLCFRKQLIGNIAIGGIKG